MSPTRNVLQTDKGPVLLHTGCQQKCISLRTQSLCLNAMQKDMF